MIYSVRFISSLRSTHFEGQRILKVEAFRMPHNEQVSVYRCRFDIGRGGLYHRSCFGNRSSACVMWSLLVSAGLLSFD